MTARQSELLVLAAFGVGDPARPGCPGIFGASGQGGFAGEGFAGPGDAGIGHDGGEEGVGGVGEGWGGEAGLVCVHGGVKVDQPPFQSKLRRLK